MEGNSLKRQVFASRKNEINKQQTRMRLYLLCMWVLTKDSHTYHMISYAFLNSLTTVGDTDG